MCILIHFLGFYNSPLYFGINEKDVDLVIPSLKVKKSRFLVRFSCTIESLKVVF